ncbi:MAG: hypothetical protein JXA13_00630 [Anaerolineales bacterium]|nr:hypothetical protein [Anaerolineales bacterium]
MNIAGKDRLFLEAGIKELPEYLLSQILYWPVTTASGVSLPRLTVGGILLAIRRLSVLSPSEDESKVLQIEMAVDTMRLKRQTLWVAKCENEFQSRLILWKNYLVDYQEGRDEQADYYPNEVRLRVMLELLLSELSTRPEEIAALSRLDGELKDDFQAGDFIWDEQLIPGFPQDVFWFLYGKLIS